MTEVEQGLRAMSDWRIRNFASDLKKLADWGQNDPKRAVDAVLKIGATLSLVQR